MPRGRRLTQKKQAEGGNSTPVLNDTEITERGQLECYAPSPPLTSLALLLLTCRPFSAYSPTLSALPAEVSDISQASGSGHCSELANEPD